MFFNYICLKWRKVRDICAARIRNTSKSGALTNNQKASFLQSTGARFRRDVILKDRILYAKSRLANISKEMSKINKISAGIQKFYNRYINYYNNEVKNSEDEQDEITKKYGY